MKLNLGCGKEIKESWVNVDREKFRGVDVVWDLNNYPYPIADSSTEEIYAKFIMEHLKEPNRFIEEIWRLLGWQRRAIIIVPHFSCIGFWSDLTHVRPFSYFSLNQYDKNFKGSTTLNNAEGKKFDVEVKIVFRKSFQLLGL